MTSMVVPYAVRFIGAIVLFVLVVWWRRSKDKRPPVGYVLGYRRTDGTTVTRTRPQGSSFLDHCDWAERTSQRPDVAEAWISFRAEEGIVRYHWLDGREVASGDE
ncbi:hypothetical protein ACQP2K_20710 [Microbispora siamensis]